MNNSEYQRYMAENAHRQLKVLVAISGIVGTSAAVSVAGNTRAMDAVNALIEQVGDHVDAENEAYRQLTEG